VCCLAKERDSGIWHGGQLFLLLLFLLLLYVSIKVQAADQQHLLQVWQGDKRMPQQLLQDGTLLHMHQ
jgi:hypothetical protein